MSSTGGNIPPKWCSLVRASSIQLSDAWGGAEGRGFWHIPSATFPRQTYKLKMSEVRKSNGGQLRDFVMVELLAYSGVHNEVLVTIAQGLSHWHTFVMPRQVFVLAPLVWEHSWYILSLSRRKGMPSQRNFGTREAGVTSARGWAPHTWGATPVRKWEISTVRNHSKYIEAWGHECPIPVPASWSQVRSHGAGE